MIDENQDQGLPAEVTGTPSEAVEEVLPENQPEQPLNPEND